MSQLLSSAEGKMLSALDSLLALPERQLRGVVVFASALTPPNELLRVINALPSPPLVILSLSFEPDELQSERPMWWAKLLRDDRGKSEILPKRALNQARDHFRELETIRDRS